MCSVNVLKFWNALGLPVTDTNCTAPAENPTTASAFRILYMYFLFFSSNFSSVLIIVISH
jgi:hypothetical protein